ncbi:hypothetical protein Q757_10405, partial [Oenococcus alcoholitolerans]
IKIANSGKLIYYGQITTVNSDQTTNVDTLTANYIWNIFNGEIIVKSYSGTNYELHIVSMLKKYFSSNAGTIISGLTSSTSTVFAVTNSEGVSTCNLIDYLIRGFKLHNVVLGVNGLIRGIANGMPFYYPNLDVHQVT